MSTRSIVEFQTDGEPIVSVYQQFDGYPDGVGLELYEFLKDFTIVNGIGLDGNRQIANGMRCLAAQFIAEFKTNAGGLYIAQLEQREEYNYLVNAPFDTGNMTVTVLGYDGDEELFEGTVEEFGKFCNEN